MIVWIPEDFEQFIEDTLQHSGSVKISLTSHQDLTLVGIAGNTYCGNVLSGASIIVGFVETKELQRPVNP